MLTQVYASMSLSHNGLINLHSNSSSLIIAWCFFTSYLMFNKISFRMKLIRDDQIAVEFGNMTTDFKKWPHILRWLGRHYNHINLVASQIAGNSASFPTACSGQQQRKHQRSAFLTLSLQWRHNEHNSVPYHRRLHCLLNSWFRRRLFSQPFI